MKGTSHGAAILACAVVGALHAQSPDVGAARPAFEVVSVKPNRSGDTRRSFRMGPGQLSAINVTARHVMGNAYGLQDFEILGGPGWLATERFDIVAKAVGIPSPGDMRLMLRSLLADRFSLRAHSAMQEVPIYALMPAREDRRLGPRLRAASGPCVPAANGFGDGCGFSVGASSLRGPAVTLARLAGELTGFVGRRVEDRTGLTGVFDVDLQWSADQSDLGPSIFSAIQEQLGLKLDSQRAPGEVLIIDGAEPPAED